MADLTTALFTRREVMGLAGLDSGTLGLIERTPEGAPRAEPGPVAKGRGAPRLTYNAVDFLVSVVAGLMLRRAGVPLTTAIRFSRQLEGYFASLIRGEAQLGDTWLAVVPLELETAKARQRHLCIRFASLDDLHQAMRMDAGDGHGIHYGAHLFALDRCLRLDLLHTAWSRATLQPPPDRMQGRADTGEAHPAGIELVTLPDGTFRLKAGTGPTRLDLALSAAVGRAAAEIAPPLKAGEAARRVAMAAAWLSATEHELKSPAPGRELPALMQRDPAAGASAVAEVEKSLHRHLDEAGELAVELARGFGPQHPGAVSSLHRRLRISSSFIPDIFNPSTLREPKP